MASVNAL